MPAQLNSATSHTPTHHLQIITIFLDHQIAYISKLVPHASLDHSFIHKSTNIIFNVNKITNREMIKDKTGIVFKPITKRAQSMDTFSRIRTRLSFRPIRRPQGITSVASQFSKRTAHEGSTVLYPGTREGVPLPFLHLPREATASAPSTKDKDFSYDSSEREMTWTAGTMEDDDEMKESIVMHIRFPSLSLGKISILILLIASLTDVTISTFGNNTRNARPSLGTAAISSVTAALSPILPFTGGVDLRREDYWTSYGNNRFDSIRSVTSQLRKAFAESAEHELFQDDEQNRQKVSFQNRQKVSFKPSISSRSNYPSPISAQKPFVSLDIIASLTLQDMSVIFTYVMEGSGKGFNLGKVLVGKSREVQSVINAIDTAVRKSRGEDSKPFSIQKGSGGRTGNVDALVFAAAMRVFAEWRMLRQVPDGYKGYAVGMALGQKDVVQNLVKIEQAVHTWLDYNRDLRKLQEEYDGKDPHCWNLNEKMPTTLRSPSLRELLEFEIEMDINPLSRLPRLVDKSSAMGLLWVRRQLQYQTHIFRNVLLVGTTFESTREAIAAAYNDVYDRFHGWAVQKIFNYSFQAAPDAVEVIKHMSPRKLKEIRGKAEHTLQVHKKSKNDQKLHAVGLKSDGKVHFLAFLFERWDVFATLVTRKDNQIVDRKESIDTNSLDSFIREEMLKDAHIQIQVYLDQTQPLLDDLDSLFQDLNMDDPTKV